jgi:mono/diheme cytochrome c family protein
MRSDIRGGAGRGGIAALVLVFAVALAAPGARADDRGIEDFPPGKGREETADLCAACHSGRLVSQQGMTRAQWDETMTLMTVRHKMPEIVGEERQLILDYLAMAFPPRRSRGAPNPFLR